MPTSVITSVIKVLRLIKSRRMSHFILALMDGITGAIQYIPAQPNNQKMTIEVK